MSQYTEGNVTLVQYSATVVGASCDWLTASAAKIGDLFKKQGQNAWYQITSVNLATNINISPVYATASVAGVDYLIVRDFTPYYDWPEITAGDLDFQDAYTRAIRAIDAKTYLLASGFPQGGNKWWNIAADVGTTASPNASKDTLTFAGVGGMVASIDGDTLTIRNASAVKWHTITGDAGSTTPNVVQDNLTFAGKGDITSSIGGDTVTISNIPIIQFITASYHTAIGDSFIIASMSIGTPASTFLPDASVIRRLRFACASGDMIIIASGTDTIGGNATLGVRTDYLTKDLQSDGLETWYVF